MLAFRKKMFSQGSSLLPSLASAQDIEADPAVQARRPAKTSLSHPININWILPHESVPTLSYHPSHHSLTPLGPLALASSNPSLRDPMQLQPKWDEMLGRYQSLEKLGNLALCSCPGKKVRLDGSVQDRAAINRDLNLDFSRIRSFNVTTIVCCLSDEELSYLGAPWTKYLEAAQKHKLEVIRLPMVEGGCPDTLEAMDQILEQVSARVHRGENVLAHCRGGIGRAGLVACCFLLKEGYCSLPEHAIETVRIRRSPKAIETMQQVDYIVKFAQYIAERIG
ncbi:uncharacterized protein VTP21DRAFT_9171 [Calcarisporiella thermophila]|uniref:uncharacterized protein n=1 Tax=Calcarisporiella thermophila TaxID=911321 RepID=UPI0037431B06